MVGKFVTTLLLCFPDKLSTFRLQSSPMVEQMVNSKFSKYGLGKCGSLLAISDKQPQVAIKKVGLRDLQNDNGTTVSSKPYGKFPPQKGTDSTENVIQVSSKPLGKFPSQRESDSTENANLVLGAKNPIPDPFSSPPRLQSPSSNNSNPHLVYARRKSDAEVIKRVSEQTRNADCPESGQFNKKRAISQPQATVTESKGEGKSEIAPIPMNSTVQICFPDSLQNDQRHVDVNPAVPCIEEREQHWSERFIRLQNYLKHCDNSNQEAYVQKVRSFTVEERSKHAVELEKRAINLLLEEGRELERMKVLNVLGKICSK
ncbi:hypothetical protein LguiB_032924 [Lonicera macranthoides]